MNTQHRIIEPKKYRLTTAEILYRLPDYPRLLQSFVWQKLDIAPEFPLLHEFLDFWDRNLDGAIYSVRVADREIVGPTSHLRAVEGNFVLH